MRIFLNFVLICLVNCTSKKKPASVVFTLNDNQVLARQLVDSGSQEDCDTAIALFTQAIKFDSNNAEAYWRRGDAYYRTRRYDLALEDLNKSWQVDSNFSYSQVISDRGQAKDMLSRYEDAISDFTKAINHSLKMDTTIPQGLEKYYYNRASCKLEIGDTILALSDIDSAIHFWSSHHYAIKRRAKVLTALRKYKEAMLDYDRLMKQGGDFPDDEEWAADFYYRAIAKQKTGRKDYSRDYKIAKKYGYYPGKPIYIKGIIDCG
jgi:tetratricopeptide (TPR) repeat protein